MVISTSRAARIKELRGQGWSYEAIAREIFKEGLTGTKLSKVRIQQIIEREAPHLMGPIRVKLKLPRMTRAHNDDR